MREQHVTPWESSWHKQGLHSTLQRTDRTGLWPISSGLSSLDQKIIWPWYKSEHRKEDLTEKNIWLLTGVSEIRTRTRGGPKGGGIRSSFCCERFNFCGKKHDLHVALQHLAWLLTRENYLDLFKIFACLLPPPPATFSGHWIWFPVKTFECLPGCENLFCASLFTLRLKNSTAPPSEVWKLMSEIWKCAMLALQAVRAGCGLCKVLASLFSEASLRKSDVHIHKNSPNEHRVLEA